MYYQNSLCCNLFPLALPLFAVPPQKAFSVTILHVFEDSNDISPSPFLIKAEQISHSSVLVHHALQPSSPGLNAARALHLQGNSNRNTLLQPATVTSRHGCEIEGNNHFL